MTPAQQLRKLLDSPGVLVMPGCYDAFSARLVERAGFKLTFMGGFAVSAARIGMPDLDLLLINPGGRETIYQALGADLTAVEPPLWCRLIGG